MVCHLEINISTKRQKQYYGIICELLSSVKNDLNHCEITSKSETSVTLGSNLYHQFACDHNSKLPSKSGNSQVDYGMASRTSKNKVDMTPNPDRYRIFQYHRKKNMLVVFPDGEVVEGRCGSCTFRAVTFNFDQ